MKRMCVWLVVLLLFIVAGPARAAVEVTVEMAGAEDFVRLKDGIRKTIAARCLAAGAPGQPDAALSVSLMELGDTISFDAILDSRPPRAFHRDVSSLGEISGVIDQMIAELAASPTQAPAAQATETPQAPARGSLVEVPPPPAPSSGLELPFAATSLAMLDRTIYVSDAKTLYRLEGTEAVPCWSTPGAAKILRIHAHGDSLLVVANRGGSLHTYQVRGADTVQSWDRCVIPLGGSLVMSRLVSDLSFSEGSHSWESPVTTSGEAAAFPRGTDFASALDADIEPSISGTEVLAFDRTGHLGVFSGGERLSAADRTVSTLSLYLEASRAFGAKNEEPDSRYYLMPRILFHEGKAITIANEQGGWRFLGNVKFYESSRILAFSRGKSGLEERELAIIKKHYCADIALDQGELVMLVVKKASSLIERIDL
jgi:hypothetical protein